MTAENKSRLSRRRSQRTPLLADQRGSAAVEFAMVAAPFLALLVALMQSFLIFLAAQQLETVVDQTSRLILTGQAQNAGTSQSAFAQQLCAATTNKLFSCNNLSVDVRAYSSFSAANVSTPSFNAQGQPTVPLSYNPGTQGQIVVVRVMYQWPVFASGLVPGLSNMSNGNRLLMATAVFKNEPYQ